MKNIIINIIGKYLGINKVLEWVNGYGSHIAGGGIALMGLSQILIDLVPVLATKNPSTIVTFASSLAAHPGAHKFLEGIAVIRLRMAVAKSTPDKPL